MQVTFGLWRVILNINFTETLRYITTLNVKELKNMFAFYRLIFNMKIHRWKVSR